MNNDNTHEPETQKLWDDFSRLLDNGCYGEGIHTTQPPLQYLASELTGFIDQVAEMHPFILEHLANRGDAEVLRAVSYTPQHESIHICLDYGNNTSGTLVCTPRSLCATSYFGAQQISERFIRFDRDGIAETSLALYDPIDEQLDYLKAEAFIVQKFIATRRDAARTSL